MQNDIWYHIQFIIGKSVIIHGGLGLCPCDGLEAPGEKEAWIVSLKERYLAKFEANTVVSIIENPVDFMADARMQSCLLLGGLMQKTLSELFADIAMRK
jgi:hypothetical protein